MFNDVLNNDKDLDDKDNGTQASIPDPINKGGGMQIGTNYRFTRKEMRAVHKNSGIIGANFPNWEKIIKKMASEILDLYYFIDNQNTVSPSGKP